MTTLRMRLAPAVRLAAVFAASLVVFALLLLTKGAHPIDGYRAMWNSITRDSTAFGDVLVRLTPYLLATLAVVVPARAGLFNIGGEGQLLLGAIGSMWAADRLGQDAPRSITLLAMAITAMVFAAGWAALPGLLRNVAGTNETISTLLFNYLAILLLGWLVFGRWKDPASTGFPRTRAFTDVERLPILWGRVHIGLLVALVAAVLVWAALRYSPWGFKLGVLGGNPEAARRAGFRTGYLSMSALMVGGALAGLGGMLQASGVEGNLRPGIMSGYGFTAVLAAWMVKHSPIKAIASSFVLAAIAIGGNGLKIREGLSAASVNILMAIILLAVLGWGTQKRGTVMIEAIAVGAVRGGTSIVFAGVGETIAERSGVINLGAEGSMLVGALAAYAVGIETGSPWLGALVGVLAGMVLALLHGVLVLIRGANQIATGLAITFLGLGATALFGQSYVSQGVEPFDTWAVPGLSEIPFFGNVLFDHDALTYLSFVLAPAAWWFLFRTRTGLQMRAAGERPAVLDTMGIDPSRSRWIAVAIGGGLAGLGGAQLATAFARTWSENMVAGRGFIAVALVIFAGWNPMMIVVGAYLFSGAVALELELQARGTDVSIFLLDAIPYLVVIIVLSLLSRRRQHAAPESLTSVFDSHATAL